MTLFWSSPTSTFWQTPTTAPFWNTTTWSETAIGTGTTGSFSASAGTYTVAGSTAGDGVNGTSDSVYFGSQTATGNIEIEGKVTGQTGTDPYAIAGLMVSDLSSADPQASQCALISVSPDNGVNFSYRTSDGGTASTILGPSLAAPVWLRLVVSQTSAAGFQSSDGISWQLVGSCTMTLPTYYFVGFAVSSNSTSLTNTATFTQVVYMTGVPQRSTSFLSNWNQTSVGGASGSFTPGSGGNYGGDYTVGGTGNGISGISDSLYFANQPVSGNIQMIAYLSGQSATNVGAAAGLMVSDLSSGSPNAPACAFLGLSPENSGSVPPGGINFFYRLTDGGSAASSTQENIGSTTTAPLWLRLTVSGAENGQSQVEGDFSSDGVTWYTAGTVTMTLPATYYAGFAVCSYSGSTNVATFTQATALRSANMLTWLRADDNVLYNVSNEVNQWSDQSTNANNATESTTADQPTIATNVINGLPAVNFNGGEFLQLPAGYANFSLGLSIFVVLEAAALSAGSTILDLGNGSASDNLGLKEIDSSGGVEFYAYNGSTASNVSATGALSTSQFQLLEAFYDGVGSASLRINGVQIAQSSGLVSARNLTRADNFIGQTGNGGSYFSGKVGELFIYNRLLSGLEIGNLESYLLTKYGI